MAKMPLHNLLCDVLTKAGQEIPHCYYQPPANMQIIYPCIIYSLSNDQNRFADNKRYKRYKRYSVIIIDTDPDSKIPYILQEIPYCSLNRVFSSDGLTNYVHDLYYDGARYEEELNYGEN